MKYLLVLLVSLFAGGAVYVLTLRASPDESSVGFGFAPEALRRRHRRPAVPAAAEPEAAHTVEPAALEPPGTGFAYLRVLTGRPTWQERVQGLLGVVILVIASSILLAAAAYEVGHLINSTLSRFLTTK
jgi:hypothetical protein